MSFFTLQKTLLVTTLFGIVGCNDAKQNLAAVEPAEVGVYTTISQAIILTTELPGRTSAYRLADVRPQVSGIILKRLFVEGSEVKEGQQLYQIDAATYQAAYNKAQANLINSERVMKRLTQLKNSGAASKQDYDNAYYSWKQAQADKEVAQINLVYSKVLSPISGKIGRSNVTEGALVTNGQAQALAVVQQIDPIYVDIIQPMSQILHWQNTLAAGLLESNKANQAEVYLRLEDGSIYPLKGTLQFSEVSVNQTTGSVTLRAQFPNPDRKLRPGMFVHAQLHEGIAFNSILVPQQGVIRDLKGQPQAWIVKADNSLELRTLKTERTVGNAWLVSSGIAANEKVVTEGMSLVAAGKMVKPIPAKNVDLQSHFGSMAGRVTNNSLNSNSSGSSNNSSSNLQGTKVDV